jgi:hypothetical protein
VVLGDGDRLQQHRPAGNEALGAAAEELAEVLVADRLDHLDRHELVVGALEVPVVLEEHGDAVAEAGRADALARELVLGRRDGGRGDPAAGATRRVQREAAPARADLEHVILRPERELAADRVELRRRRLRERHVRPLEQRTRVHHRLVEEQLEEVVAEVVVRSDVAPASRPRVAVQPVCGAAQRGRQDREAVFHRIERLPVPEHQAQQGRQVVRLPVAEHVRLSCADGAAEGDLGVERGIEHRDAGLGAGALGSEREDFARVANAQEPFTDFREACEDEPAREGAEWPHARPFAPRLDQRGVVHAGLLPMAFAGWTWKGTRFARSRSASQ